MAHALAILKARQHRAEGIGVPPEATAMGRRVLAWADSHADYVADGHAEVIVESLRKALDMGDVFLSPFLMEFWSACPESIKETTHAA